MSDVATKLAIKMRWDHGKVRSRYDIHEVVGPGGGPRGYRLGPLIEGDFPSRLLAAKRRDEISLERRRAAAAAQKLLEQEVTAASTSSERR